MTATIRIAAPPDAAAIAELGARTFSDTFGHQYHPSDLRKFLEKSHAQAVYERLLANPSCRIWIAEAPSGEIVGYASVGPCDLPVPNMPRNAGELQRFYLLKPYQGAGLGSQLLSRALDWLEARFDHIYLSVYAENHGAQRLYERYGFQKVHDYFYMVGDHPDPEWIMKRVGQ